MTDTEHDYIDAGIFGLSSLLGWTLARSSTPYVYSMLSSLKWEFKVNIGSELALEKLYIQSEKRTTIGHCFHLKNGTKFLAA